MSRIFNKTRGIVSKLVFNFEATPLVLMGEVGKESRIYSTTW